MKWLVFAWKNVMRNRRRSLTAMLITAFGTAAGVEEAALERVGEGGLAGRGQAGEQEGDGALAEAERAFGRGDGAAGVLGALVDARGDAGA